MTEGLHEHEVEKSWKDGYELGYLEGTRGLIQVRWLHVGAAFVTGLVVAMGVFAMIFTGAWCP